MSTSISLALHNLKTSLTKHVFKIFPFNLTLIPFLIALIHTLILGLSTSPAPLDPVSNALLPLHIIQKPVICIGIETTTLIINHLSFSAI